MNGKIEYYNRNNVQLAFSNMLWYSFSATWEDVKDVIEDSDTSYDLVNGLQKLYKQKKINEKFYLDRETGCYVRLISKDVLGNIHYLKVYK